jgi:hypothetical protein
MSCIYIKTSFIVSSKFHEACFVKIHCNFICFKAMVQLGKSIINAILKVVSFKVIYDDTSIMRKEYRFGLDYKMTAGHRLLH